MKKYIIMLTLLTLSACSAEKKEKQVENAKPVKMMTIHDIKNVHVATFPGKVAAGETAELSFKVKGMLEDFPVKEGEEVSFNQMLARLDQTDYKLAYEKSLAAFNEAQAAFKRAEELVKNKYISQADFDNKRKAFEITQADMNIAKTNLDYTTLRAPFKGEIAKTYVDNHQNIQPNEPIAVIQNLSYLDVKISVPERIFSYRLKAKKINFFIKLDAYPDDKFVANIREAATKADPQTQTYEVTVRFKKPEGIYVYPGMTATVEANVILSENSLDSKSFDIPADAIFSDAEKNSYVWVVNKENRLQKRKVETQNFENNSVTISSGLNIGDTIVTTGVNFLRENQLVKPYSIK